MDPSGEYQDKTQDGSLEKASKRKISGQIKEMDTSKKKKKCGFENKKNKEKRELEKSAASCKKITDFCTQKDKKHGKNFEGTSSIDKKTTGASLSDCVSDITVGKKSSDTEEKGTTRDCVSDVENIINEGSSSEENKSISDNKEKGKNGDNANAISEKISSSQENKSIGESKEPNNFCSKSGIRDGLDDKIDKYFKKPAETELFDFFSYHPKQEEQFSDKKPDFNEKVFFGDTSRGIRRLWLTYNKILNKLFCSICLAFSKGTSTFCSGFKNWNHIYERVIEHEKSKCHIDCVKSFMRYKMGKSVKNLVHSESQIEKLKSETMMRRHIVCMVIRAVKFLGKQGLALRGDKSESAYNLFDSEANLNLGNFLELIKLLSESDSVLKCHLEKIYSKSVIQKKKFENSKKKKSGRGNLVTFLSKTTVNKIIQIIGNEIKYLIANDIKKAGIFSVMMDTTMDITSYDQCVITLRYVFQGVVHERVIGLKKMTSTTGQCLFDTLKSTVEDMDLKMEMCVANSFDGASNMRGQYKGVAAKLKKLNPNNIHTWCYSHVLNLVITDVSKCVTQSISFFGLIQETFVFFKESYKRLQVYESQNPKLKLSGIGATRWRSKHDATVKIFGRIDFWTQNNMEKEKLSKAVYLQLLNALYLISESREFKAKIRGEALGLFKKYCAFETILVAMMFLQIFNITTPTSDYLQTKNLDYILAWKNIDFAIKTLKDQRNKFDEVRKAADSFVVHMNEKLESSDEFEDFFVEEELPVIRSRKKKILPGEKAKDEMIEDPKKKFEVEVYIATMDTIKVLMEYRFTAHQTLYLDISCFDPRRFKEIAKDGLPENALNKICKVNPNLEKAKLAEELKSFAKIWPEICENSIMSSYASLNDPNFDYDPEFDKDEEPLIKGDEENIEEELKVFNDKTEDKIEDVQCKGKCLKCFLCIFLILVEYNMYSTQYFELHKAYQFLLTIPSTQVSCERAFSILKLIKTRLRANLTQSHLEPLFLMQCEKDLLSKIQDNKVIDKLCEDSEEMNRLLNFIFS